jgi:hypothetical protein
MNANRNERNPMPTDYNPEREARIDALIARSQARERAPLRTEEEAIAKLDHERDFRRRYREQCRWYDAKGRPINR